MTRLAYAFRWFLEDHIWVGIGHLYTTKLLLNSLSEDLLISDNSEMCHSKQTNQQFRLKLEDK